MSLDPSKTYSLIISRSRIPLPLQPQLMVEDLTTEDCSAIKQLGVTLDSKLFSLTKKTRVLHKCKKVYADHSVDD